MGPCRCGRQGERPRRRRAPSPSWQAAAKTREWARHRAERPSSGSRSRGPTVPASALQAAWLRGSPSAGCRARRSHVPGEEAGLLQEGSWAHRYTGCSWCEDPRWDQRGQVIRGAAAPLLLLPACPPSRVVPEARSSVHTSSLATLARDANGTCEPAALGFLTPAGPHSEPSHLDGTP